MRMDVARIVPMRSQPPALSLARLFPVERLAVQLQPVPYERKAQLARNLLLQLLDVVTVKLDHPSCGDVDQMIVVAACRLLVAPATASERVPLENALLLEKI